MTYFRFASQLALGIFILTLSTYSFSNEIVRPPNDDSEKSTVRIITRWTSHSLDTAGCIDRAKKILSEARNFIDDHDKSSSVFGLVEGRTSSIRCDYEGVAFFVIAWRHRPDEATQHKTINDLVAAFKDSK